MSNGNNREFMNNPVDFLRTHTIADYGSFAARAVSGIYDLDLEFNSHADYLGYYNLEQPQEDIAIHAHYLPAKANSAMSMQLTNHAKYMFTSSLTGCLFAAYGRNAQSVTVEHVNDFASTGLIGNRLQSILDHHYPYCRILSPVLVPGTYITAYLGSACVIGVADTKGDWSFHCKRDDDIPFPL